MNEYRKTKQIHLIDMLLYCMEKWRLIIVCMLIAAVTAGSRTYLFTVKENQEKQNLLAAIENTQNRENQENSGETVVAPSARYYEQAIAETECDLEIQEDYLNHSVVMKMDPYHISTGNLSYYMDGGENTDSLFAAYNTFISSGRMAEELYQQETDIPVEDLRYLISFTNNMNWAGKKSTVFQIQIRMPDGSQGENYLKRAEEVMDRYISQLRADMGEHQVTLLASVESEMSDIDIQNYQTTVRTTYITTVRNLQALRTEYETIQNVNSTSLESGNSENGQKSEDGENNGEEISNENIVLENPVSSAINSALYGLLLGACLPCVVLFILYLFGGRIQDIEDCNREFGIPLLGIVRESERKRKKFEAVDSCIFRLRGGIYGRVGLEEQIKIAAANVQAAISAQSFKGELNKILFAGTVEDKDVEALSTKLASKIHGISASSYTQLIFQSEALMDLENYGGVVFIEKRGTSYSRFVEQEMKLAKDRNVTVLGIIVVC